MVIRSVPQKLDFLSNFWGALLIKKSRQLPYLVIVYFHTKFQPCLNRDDVNNYPSFLK